MSGEITLFASMTLLWYICWPSDKESAEIKLCQSACTMVHLVAQGQVGAEIALYALHLVAH